MSKEWLEEIEERILVDKVYYKYIDETKGHWGKVYTLSEEDYNYLKERVHELEQQNKRYRKVLEEIRDIGIRGRIISTGEIIRSKEANLAEEALEERQKEI